MGERSDLEFPSGQGEPCAGDAPERIAADQIDFLSRQGLLGA